MQDVCPDASLTVVGGGTEELRLRALAASLDLRRVTFAGRVAPEAIAAFYGAHDIYLQSPNLDNMPASVLEAFASGLPVVSTEAGGVPAILRHGEHGLLAPGERRGGTCWPCAAVARESRLGAQPRRRRLSHPAGYTWATVREQWIALYRSALPRGAERAAAVQA